MKVSVEAHKVIKCTIYSTVFFLLQVEVLLVALTLIEQIIKDTNLMSILFSVNHPKTFLELKMSLLNIARIISNMYTYPFNPQLLIKT